MKNVFKFMMLIVLSMSLVLSFSGCFFDGEDKDDKKTSEPVYAQTQEEAVEGIMNALKTSDTEAMKIYVDNDATVSVFDKAKIKKSVAESINEDISNYDYCEKIAEKWTDLFFDTISYKVGDKAENGIVSVEFTVANIDEIEESVRFGVKEADIDFDKMSDDDVDVILGVFDDVFGNINYDRMDEVEVYNLTLKVKNENPDDEENPKYIVSEEDTDWDDFDEQFTDML